MARQVPPTGIVIIAGLGILDALLGLVGVLVLTYLFMVRDEYTGSERSIASAHGDIR